MLEIHKYSIKEIRDLRDLIEEIQNLSTPFLDYDYSFQKRKRSTLLQSFKTSFETASKTSES